MPTLLEQALAKISALPPDEQEEIAGWILCELEDEERWQRTFAAAMPMLEKMAAEAQAEYDAGLTTPFPD